MSSAQVDEEAVAVSRQDVEVNYQEEKEVLLLVILSPILIMLRWLRWADRRGSSSSIHNT